MFFSGLGKYNTIVILVVIPSVVAFGVCYSIKIRLGYPFCSFVGYLQLLEKNFITKLFATSSDVNKLPIVTFLLNLAIGVQNGSSTSSAAELLVYSPVGFVLADIKTGKLLHFVFILN